MNHQGENQSNAEVTERAEITERTLFLSFSLLGALCDLCDLCVKFFPDEH